MRNAALILPTAQMCDQCTNDNACYLQGSSKVNLEKHQSTFGSSENSGEAQSADPDFTDAIWKVVADSLDMLDTQLNEERQLRTLGFFSNAFDSSRVEQGPNVASCLSKVDGAS